MKTLLAVVEPGSSSFFPRAFRSGVFVAESFDFIRGRLSLLQLFPPAFHGRKPRANIEAPGAPVRPMALLFPQCASSRQPRGDGSLCHPDPALIEPATPNRRRFGYTYGQPHFRTQCARVFGRLSEAEARVDGLDPVFAPEVFAELDLNGDAFRRRVVGGDCCSAAGSNLQAARALALMLVLPFGCCWDLANRSRKAKPGGSVARYIQSPVRCRRGASPNGRRAAPPQSADTPGPSVLD